MKEREELKCSVYLNGERMENQEIGRQMFLAACRPTPKAMNGTWILTAPDGRMWQADSPLKCCSLELHDRVPADVRMARIQAALAEPDPLEVENSRLRERVGELENKLQLMHLNSDHFERTSQATSDRERLTSIQLTAALERGRLLLGAVRWCLDTGAVIAVHRNGVSEERRLVNCGDFDPITPPAHLAPLIAEAVKP